VGGVQSTMIETFPSPYWLIVPNLVAIIKSNDVTIDEGIKLPQVPRRPVETKFCMTTQHKPSNKGKGRLVGSTASHGLHWVGTQWDVVPGVPNVFHSHCALPHHMMYSYCIWQVNLPVGDG